MIGGEDEVGRVAGRSAGVGKRALFDQDQVVPAESSQMLDQAIADDAGSDDGDLALGGRGSSCGHSWCLLLLKSDR